MVKKSPEPSWLVSVAKSFVGSWLFMLKVLVV